MFYEKYDNYDKMGRWVAFRKQLTGKKKQRHFPAGRENYSIIYFHFFIFNEDYGHFHHMIKCIYTIFQVPYKSRASFGIVCSPTRETLNRVAFHHEC
jgi:hypothetical protein